MDWIKLENETQLEEIDRLSEQEYVLIYKHSTRCGISSSALNRLDREWQKAQQKIRSYYLDLLQYPHLSALVAAKYAVRHESPQVLLISKGKCIYHSSHSTVSYTSVLEQAGAAI